MSKIKNKNKNACLKTESHGADRLTRDCCFRSPESMQISRILFRNLTQYPTRNTTCNPTPPGISFVTTLPAATTTQNTNPPPHAPPPIQDYNWHHKAHPRAFSAFPFSLSALQKKISLVQISGSFANKKAV
nr:hypothetical protein [Neisseria chenwenguii]